MGLWRQIWQKVGPKAKTYREGPWLKSSQGSVIKTATVAQSISSRRVADTSDKKQGRRDHFGIFGLGNSVGVLLHRAAWVPRVKCHGFGDFINHRQTDFSALRVFHEFAVFFPPMQRRQGVEFTFDRPISPNDSVRAGDQPYAHHLL